MFVILPDFMYCYHMTLIVASAQLFLLYILQLLALLILLPTACIFRYKYFTLVTSLYQNTVNSIDFRFHDCVSLNLSSVSFFVITKKHSQNAIPSCSTRLPFIVSYVRNRLLIYYVFKLLISLYFITVSVTS
jgi:hypothetical protein